MKRTRRIFLETGALGATTLFGLTSLRSSTAKPVTTDLPPEFPGQDRASVQAIVGASHSDLDKVREMVNARPALARARWDWGFGDWETPLGAASHMGTRDIAEVLIDHGASPNIFTHAMMGNEHLVRQSIETYPGIQSRVGPHGLSLLFHAQMPLRREFMEGDEKTRQEELVRYLEELGDADPKPESLEMTAESQQEYMGRYDFGSGTDEYFIIDRNERRGLLSMSRADQQSRVLFLVGERSFAPSGAPAVRIRFSENFKELQVFDPDLIVTARHVGT